MTLGGNSLLSIALIATIASIWMTQNAVAATEKCESQNNTIMRYRLPNNTIPRLYSINVEPNMEDENFTWIGETSIDIEILAVTRNLTLHAYKNLVIDKKFTKLVSVCDDVYPIEQRHDVELEFFKINFNSDILPGNYTLNLKYTGVNTGDNFGFYKASVPGPGLPNVAATNFEPARARRAFPCWDEPALKAHFQLSIKHYPNYTAISNMPEIKRIKTLNGKILTTFDKTPVMSTYLFTFVIADYESITNEHGNVTVWAGKNVLDEVQHVLNTSQRIVDFMESYTGLPFGLPRIGSVAIPIYPNPAVEHWGLISYRIEDLTVNRTTDKTTELDNINMTIAHELAHSWFGNRVSPLWWNDIWLNEGLSHYFEYYIMSEIDNKSSSMERFVVMSNQEYLFAEEDAPTNPGRYVRWAPTTNIDIEKVFTPFMYRKGGAIIHMFRNVLTDTVFRTGLQKFLTKHSFKAADTSDLIGAFQEAYDENYSNKYPLNVKDAMMPWLMQPGYPMINVVRNYTTGYTNITQKCIVNETCSTSRWWIPLNYATTTNPNFSLNAASIFISDKEDSVRIDGIKKDDWVIFNPRASGYYRVNYDDVNWERLTEYLNTDRYTNIHVLNRAQLLNDAFYIWRWGPLRNKTVWWELTKYLSREVEFSPWYSAMRGFEHIQSYLVGTEIYETFQKYIFVLIDKLVTKLGFETFDDDDLTTKLSKELLVGWACKLGHTACTEFSATRLLRLMENPVANRLHPDNKNPIFCAGLRGLNDTAARKFINWALANDKDTLVDNLGCIDNHEIHQNFFNLEIATSSEKIYFGLFAMLTRGDENFNFAIDFFVKNNEAIIKIFHSNDRPNDLFDIVDWMSFFTKTKSRLEKLREIYKLDVVINDAKIQNSRFLEEAEKRVEKVNLLVSKFRESWNNQFMFQQTG